MLLYTCFMEPVELRCVRVAVPVFRYSESVTGETMGEELMAPVMWVCVCVHVRACTYTHRNGSLNAANLSWFRSMLDIVVASEQKRLNRSLGGGGGCTYLRLSSDLVLVHTPALLLSSSSLSLYMYTHFRLTQSSANNRQLSRLCRKREVYRYIHT